MELHWLDQPLTWLYWTGLHVTGWKLIGYVGALMFGGRWLVQFVASKRAGKPVIPRMFWYMSCLLYTSPSPRDQRGSRMPSSA